MRPKGIVLLSVAIVLLVAAGGVGGHGSAGGVRSLQSSRTSGKVPSGGAVASGPPTSHRQDKIAQAYDKLPMSFEPNQGQAGKRVKFVSHGGGYLLMLSPAKAELVLTRTRAPGVHQVGGAIGQRRVKEAIRNPVESRFAIGMKLLGANGSARAEGVGKLPGISNYFVGNDRSRWHTQIPNYAKVRFQSVYPGIDLVYRGNQHQLEYDLIASPGADPRRIRLGLDGVDKLEINASGDLVLHQGRGQIAMRKPVAYQEDQGVRREIRASYRRLGNAAVGFRIAGYDRRKPLIIDPTIVYSTFLGGVFASSRAIAVDLNGDAYVTGTTGGVSDFPVTNGSYKTGSLNAFVTELNPSGSSLVYSTYLGGNLVDQGFGITADLSHAYVTGFTNSSNFPTVPSSAEPCSGCVDAFVSVLDPSGNLVASVLLGGTAPSVSFGQGIATDANDSVYVVGYTDATTFPNANNAFGGSVISGFAVKFSPLPLTPEYSTVVPADVSSVAADWQGNNLYLAGTTSAPGFQVSGRAFAGTEDAFVARLDTTQTGASSVIYATYLGGTADDTANGIAIPLTGGSTSTRLISCLSNCNAYVTGFTTSTDFPVTPGALQTSFDGVAAAFVADLSASGAVQYATYLGGGFTSGAAIAVDSLGRAFVTGLTTTTEFPTVQALQNFQGPNGEIIESSDRGSSFFPTTWPGSIAGSVPNNAITGDVTVTPPNPIFIGTNRTGVWRSTDGGANFAQLSTLTTGIDALALSTYTAPHTLYAGGLGLFSSTDYGNSFATLNLPAGAGPVLSIVPGDSNHPQDLLVGTENGFYLSTSGGATFGANPLAAGTAVFGITYLDLGPPPPSGPDDSLKIYLATNRGVLVSSDSGASFVSTYLNFVTTVSIALDPSTSPPTVYAGLLGDGLFSSQNDFSNYQFSEFGLLFPTAWSIAVDFSGPSGPGGAKPVYAGVFDVFSFQGSLWKSTNGGVNFSQVVGLNPPGGGYKEGAIEPVIVLPSVGAAPPLIFAGVFEEIGAFASVLNSTGTALSFSTPMGGTSPNYGFGVALDSNDNSYYTGTTASANFPVEPTSGPTPAYQTSFGDQNPIYAPYNTANGFIVKLTNTYSGTSSSETQSTIVPITVPNNPTVSDVTVTYANVAQNQEGQTDVIVTSTAIEPGVPLGFVVENTNSQPTYIYVITNANVSGPVAVCVNYTPSQFINPSALQMFYFENPVWIDATTSNDPVSGVICGLAPDSDFVAQMERSAGRHWERSVRRDRGGHVEPAFYSFGGGSIGGIAGLGSLSGLGLTGPVVGLTFLLGGNGLGGILPPPVIILPKKKQPDASQVTLSPQRLSFASNAVGSISAAQTVTLTNASIYPLPVYSVAIDSNVFAETDNCVGVVGAQRSCVISVVFAPAQTGTQSAVLKVSDLTNIDESPDAVQYPLTAALTGIGTAPTQAVTAAPDAISFTPQSVGTTSRPKSVALSNHQSTALQVGTISASGDFLTASNNCGSSLAPGGSCLIGVAFAPTTSGERTGQLTIAHGATGSPLTVALSGAAPAPTPTASATATNTAATATPAAKPSSTPAPRVTARPTAAPTLSPTPAPTPTAVPAPDVVSALLSVTPHKLGLGKESLSNAANGQTSATTTKAKRVVLFNPKSAKQNQTIVIEQVTAAGDFTIPAKVCVGPLAPGQRCTVHVSFVPTGTGLRKGALTIESNARNGTQTVSLRGTGVKAKSH